MQIAETHDMTIADCICLGCVGKLFHCRNGDGKCSGTKFSRLFTFVVCD